MALFAVGTSTCYFGVDYEIAQIPEEQREAMDDFDWIGVEWIARGMVIIGAALILGVVGLIRWWRIDRGSGDPAARAS